MRLIKRHRFLIVLGTFTAILVLVSGGVLAYFNLPQEQVLGANTTLKNVESNPAEVAKITAGTVAEITGKIAESVQSEDEPDEIVQRTSALLDVPLIKQKYKLSCEATTIQMALEYRGITKTQEELMDDIGYALPLNPQQTSNSVIWGDPDVGFVGDYKGEYVVARDGELKGGGWGTHEGPVLNFVRKYRPGSYAQKLANENDLKEALNDDMPVIFWHVRDDHDTEKLEYFSPNGQRVVFEQFHVKILIGYEERNGDTFWKFNDPIYGQYELDNSRMLKQWNAYNARMVAVG